MAGLLVADEAGLERAVARLREEGRTVVEAVGAAVPGTVFASLVADREDAADVVLAALAGADVVVACTAADDVVDDLIDDLTRLGPVRHDVPLAVPLSADQVALLGRLNEGLTLGAAAAAVHLSRRTADRRLAQARAALEVRTTAEALVAAARLGLI